MFLNCLLPITHRWFLLLLFILCFFGCKYGNGEIIDLEPGDRIAFIGGNLCSRMMQFGHFETEIQLSHPDHQLFIRNMCDGGDTPGFRPHSGRNSPWVFPGAEKFQDEFAQPSGSEGHFEYPDEWLTRLKCNVVIAFFGFSESFAGNTGLDQFSHEIDAFVNHTLSQQYNGGESPRLALVSSIAIEDLSDVMDVPDGDENNQWIRAYAQAMGEVARRHNLPYVDLIEPSLRWYRNYDDPLTIDGSQLNDLGYRILAPYLTEQLFGKKSSTTEVSQDENEKVLSAVSDKNWYWHNDYKIPNGVHVFGRRYQPFGPDNYPAEIEKIRQLTAIRDTAIWRVLQKTPYDVVGADRHTRDLPSIESNFKPGDYGRGENSYLYGEEALSTLTVAKGYKIEMFASEQEFEDLANPVQLSFDNKGRLWVATMPSYPHYRPGDPRPDDKLIILEDTDGDGKADKQTTFAEGLHLPVGFEFAPEGVYVSQGTHLKLLIDDDGDDRMDREEIVFSGFDDHDTHHVISAFCADPSGAIYMSEGVFLHTNVETSYGTVRGTNGGFYRFNPIRRHLERTAQLSIPNPWGIAFDDFGQNFFAETSGPAIRWMMPGTVQPRYGVATHKSNDLTPSDQQVRPTSGLEFISSRHFPEDVQGDLLINNTIGFLGMKQHKISEDGTGYKLTYRQDLVHGSDPNFRPVDMEFAPDGSLYFVDWHNVLIGHMQHNARDPMRDHVHGRIYRVTYPSRPLMEPAKIYGADLETLFENLKLPEYRSRYRTRREIRGRDRKQVEAFQKNWIKQLDRENPDYEHHALEALWVGWGINAVDRTLLNELLQARDHRVRAAAVRVLRYSAHQVEEHVEWMVRAAGDTHGRVRLEAIVAASWMAPNDGMRVLNTASLKDMDDWIIHAHVTALAHLNSETVNLAEGTEEDVSPDLDEFTMKLYEKGREIYRRDGYCVTCHQGDGKGLSASGFPPLADTEWVTGDAERLIKLTLNGLYGPLEVNGVAYPGLVPMTPFGKLLNDEEIAAVLTYVRNAFGNRGPLVTPEQVAQVRSSTADKNGFYSPGELLDMHPMN